MQSTQRSGYTPIKPNITDEDMIPNATEMANIAAEDDGDQSGGEKKEKSRWPNKVVYICVAIIVIC